MFVQDLVAQFVIGQHRFQVEEELRLVHGDHSEGQVAGDADACLVEHVDDWALVSVVGSAGSIPTAPCAEGYPAARLARYRCHIDAASEFQLLIGQYWFWLLIKVELTIENPIKSKILNLIALF